MSIIVNGINYKIQEEKSSFSPSSMGRTDIKQAKIFIDDSLNLDVKNNTILHELFHIFYNASGLSEKSSEEEIVEAMSNQMFAAIMANKDFFIKLIINE